jgi:hypothetical protein
MAPKSAEAPAHGDAGRFVLYEIRNGGLKQY